MLLGKGPKCTRFSKSYVRKKELHPIVSAKIPASIPLPSAHGKKKGTKCSFKLADTIARYFDVSIDYVMTGKSSLLQSGTTFNTNPRDIKKKYEEIKMLLQSGDTEPLFFDGKPAAEESIDLLLKQVEISLALIEKNWN